MSQRDFLHRIAKASPGGISALEARMGMAKNTLQNGLNPNMGATHRISEPQVELLYDYIPNGHLLAAEYHAGLANAVVIPLIEAPSSDMELLDGFIRAVRELSEFGAEFQRDFADGRITADEFERITRESDEAIAAILELRARIGQMAER